MPVSFVFANPYHVTQHFRQKRVWKARKILLLATMEIQIIYLWQCTPLRSLSHSEKVNRQLCFVFNGVQNVSSKRHTSAITAVTNSSMKSWCSTTANRHLRSSGQRSAEQRRTKVSFSRTMMQALELLQLAKRHISGQSDVEKWRNQGCLSSYACLKASVRGEWVSQSVENLTKHKIFKTS